MSYANVAKVVDYATSKDAITLRCETEADRGDAESRHLPVTIRFLHPGVFRFELDANPEAGGGPASAAAASGGPGSTEVGVTGGRATQSAAAPAPTALRDSTATARQGSSAPARGAAPRVFESGGFIHIRTDDLHVQIGREPWSFSVFDAGGTRLFSEQTEQIGPLGEPGIRGLGFSEQEINNGSWTVIDVQTAFSLSHDERLYGFGEKFTALEKRGQEIDSWTVKAHGTESERSYKNVPFFLSSRGYGLLVDTTRRVRFDLGHGTTAAATVSVSGDRAGFVFFNGPSFREILERYTRYTGRSRVPPKWSFGLWMSRAVYTSRQEVEEATARLRAEQIPCDVIHIDPLWMRDGAFCDLVWDTERFPEPQAMIEQLHESSFRVSLWEHPYLAAGSEAFSEAAAAGYLVKNCDGRPYILDGLVLDQGRGGIVDFTNPDAARWWKEKHRPLLEMGVDLFKTDFGEDVPQDAVFANGMTGAAVHNLYPNLYNQTVDEITAEVRGDRESLTWGRSAWTGGQRYPLYWAGDPSATFAGMASQLRGGLSLSLSGFPFWSHDIGGFWGEPTPELYVRWAQFGLLSSHARCHGTSPREPWHYGDEALRIFREFARLRYRLLPYIYTHAAEASSSGLPLVRPLVLEFQDDPGSASVETQFMLGPSLLVAPVLEPGGGVDIYLPPGEWIDFRSGAPLTGPQRLRREVPLDTVPIFLRAGRVVAMGPATETVQPGLPAELGLEAALSSEAGATPTEAPAATADQPESREPTPLLRATGELYDDSDESITMIEMELSSSGDALSIDLERAERFSRVSVNLRGLVGAPQSLTMNGTSLDSDDGLSRDGSWRYRTEGNAIEIRP